MKKISLGSLSKEFLPILLLIATPFLEFMQGYGVIQTDNRVNWYFVFPAGFGFVMMLKDRKHIRNFFIFLLVAALNFALSSPYIQSENLIKGGDLTYLIISYEFIIFQFMLFAMSFFRNDPYYVDYYTTETKEYRIIYNIIGVFFLGVAAFHGYLFYRVYMILRYMYEV